MDIFYPSAGTVFSKEGVFQQPLSITLIDHAQRPKLRWEKLAMF
jgi:hypothetical protein